MPLAAYKRWKKPRASNRTIISMTPIGIFLIGALVSLAPLGAAERVFVKAKVIAADPLSPTVKRIRFKLPKEYALRPAQFALVRVPPEFVQSWNARYGTSHKEVQRPYSFATDPKRLPAAEFIVQLAAPPPGKDVPPGVASTYLHGLKPGETLEVSEAMGNLYEADESTRPIVLVAGGTGVAPFVGLLEHWFRTKLNRRREILLFFGARRRQELLLDAQFMRWAATQPNFKYIPALSSPTPDDKWTGAKGFINAVVDRYFQTSMDADVLIAGSPRMMQETVKVVKAKGVPAKQIRQDPIKVAP